MKDEIIQLRVSEADKKKFKEYADYLGISLSEFIRLTMLQKCEELVEIHEGILERFRRKYQGEII